MIENNCPGFRFRNNIFVYKGAFLMPKGKLASEIFEANCFWSLSGDRKIAGYENFPQWAMEIAREKPENSFIGIFADPGFMNPGTCSLTDPTKLNAETLAAYTLKSGSPLIDRGLDLKKLYPAEPITKDITGTSLPQNKGFDIGAIEYIKEN